jgi:hypothetical protein
MCIVIVPEGLKHTGLKVIPNYSQQVATFRDLFIFTSACMF